MPLTIIRKKQRETATKQRETEKNEKKKMDAYWKIIGFYSR